MNGDRFYKPPPFATWLLFAACASTIATGSFPPELGTIAAITLVGGLLYSLYPLARWLGRVTGYAIGYALGRLTG